MGKALVERVGEKMIETNWYTTVQRQEKGGTHVFHTLI